AMADGFVLAGGKTSRTGLDKKLKVAGRDPLPDQFPGLGPLPGNALALEFTSTDANRIIAVDLPHLTKDFLKYLRSRTENSAHPLVACKIGSAFPLCLGLRHPLVPEFSTDWQRNNSACEV